jgi:septal ring factor EnvC (AmiA/AmiB activator)
MADGLASTAQIISFPRPQPPAPKPLADPAQAPADPAQERLARALASLNAALAEQRTAVQSLRTALADLQSTMQGLDQSMTDYSGRLGNVRSQVETLRHHSRVLEGIADRAIVDSARNAGSAHAPEAAPPR